MKVSIIIATYERGEILFETLALLIKQTYPHYEIIVVDQSSSSNDRLAALIAAHPDKIQYCRLAKPNVSAARNCGLRLATSELVLFLDDDVYVSDPDYLAKHVAHFEDSSIGAVMGLAALPSETDLQARAQGMYTGFEARDISREGVAIVTWVDTCNSSYLRRAVMEAGMFDEHFDINALCEDADLAVRVRSRGYKLLFDPRIQAVHMALDFGGCQNRDPERVEQRERRHLQFTTYYVLKNRRMMGSAVVVKNLLKFYRRYSLNKRVFRGGIRTIVVFQYLYVRALLVACRWCSEETRVEVGGQP